MASYRKRGQIWYFRFVNADGDKIERRGCADKRMTEAMARAAETEAAQIRNGFVDAKRLTFARSAAVSLWEHVRDFEAHLIDRGDTRAHATLYVGRLRRLAALACGAKLSDIDPGKRARREDRERADHALESALRSGRLASLTLLSVQTALASLRDSGRGANTLNHHRAAVRGFILWARKTGRIQDDPLLGLASFNVKEDLRHDRRTISLDELRRLVEAAHSGPTFREMTGPARALCYRMAVASGLRFSELKSIVPESFDFERPTPTVTVLAGFAKNGQTATLPLPRDLADDLRPWVATIPKDRPVFLLPANDGAAMLRVDLGAANIPYKDGAGRPFDFHSLRCMLATMADQAGVSPRIVQRLMRHSKLEMTDRYTRPRLADIEGAAAALPCLAPTKEDPEPLAATGTEGTIKTSPLVLAHYLPTGGPGNGRDVSHVDVVT